MRHKIANTPEYTFKKSIIACLESALLMPQGARKFPVSVRAYGLSLLIPFIVLPLTAVTFIAAHPETLSLQAQLFLSLVYLLRTIVYLGAFAGFAYILSKSLEKESQFYRLLIAHNALLLPAALLMLPLSLGFLSGHYVWDEVFPLMVCITGYFTFCLGYASVKILDIPAELGAFIAIAALAINQTALDSIKFLAVQTLHILA